MGDGKAKPKAKKPKQKLNVRQAKFVAGVLRHGAKNKAAREAGYSQKNPDQTANKLIKSPHVREAIEKGIEQVSSKALVDAEFVLGGLRLVAEKCLGRETIDRYDAMLKESVVVKDFDSAGANRSLELLGKHLKLLTDRVEHVSVNVAEDLSEARQRLKRAGS